MTPKSRFCLREQPMRCGAKPCRSSMKNLPDATSANCGFSISAVAPGDFSISSSRPGRSPNGGLELAKNYWVSFPDGYRAHQIRLEGGDCSTDSFCYPSV